MTEGSPIAAEERSVSGTAIGAGPRRKADHQKTAPCPAGDPAPARVRATIPAAGRQRMALRNCSDVSVGSSGIGTPCGSPGSVSHADVSASDLAAVLRIALTTPCGRVRGREETAPRGRTTRWRRVPRERRSLAFPANHASDGRCAWLVRGAADRMDLMRGAVIPVAVDSALHRPYR